MWTSGLDWDALIDQSQARQVKKWFEELTESSEVQVPCCLQLNSDVETVTLHTFANASGDAYGAATYVMYKYKGGTVSTSLVTPLDTSGTTISYKLSETQTYGSGFGIKIGPVHSQGS